MAPKHKKTVIEVDENGVFRGDLDLGEYVEDVQLPEGLIEITGDFSANKRDDIVALPANLKRLGGDVILSGCASITALPDKLERIEGYLYFDGTGIRELPKSLKYVFGIEEDSLYLLNEFPEGLTYGSYCDLRDTKAKPAKNMKFDDFLDLEGRNDITEWPEGVTAQSVDISGTGIDPDSVPDVVELYNP